jgi:hypothetical protein
MRPLAVLAVLVAPLAAAQPMQPDAAPVAGALRASASGDPAEVAFDVRADVLSPVDGCPGYVAPAAPDAVVDWAGGDLRVWVRAPFDATLLVAGPDGAWSCNDDAEGTSPVVQIDGAAPGRYAVWLGSFSPGPAETRSTLYAGAPPPAPALDADAAPAAGTIGAAGGFEAARGGIEVTVDAGGPDPAGDLDLSGVPGPAPFCVGYIDASRPTVAVEYEPGGGTGTFAVSAYAFDADLTLVVRGPDGAVACNDDFDGTDPTVAYADAEGGRYAVWVGTFGAPTGPVSATVVLSEGEPEVFEMFDDDEIYDDPAEPYSEGTYLPLDLDAAPAARLALDGDETVTATVPIRPAGPNPVRGPACAGSVEPAPSAGVTVSGGGPVAITASADVDLVLLVRTPSGAWYCSDDADGLDPGVQIDAPEDGLYTVWAGTFIEAADPVDVEVAVARGGLAVSADDRPDPFGPASQSSGTYDGDALGPGPGAITLDVEGVSEATVPAGGPVLNPVEGDACTGFVTAEPTATVRAGGPFEVAASAGGDDLTLLVRAADGTWTCSDDADGTDPRITVDAPEPGAYDVWVGTFSRRDVAPEVSLEVHAVPPPPPAPPPPPGRN